MACLGDFAQRPKSPSSIFRRGHSRLKVVGRGKDAGGGRDLSARPRRKRRSVRCDGAPALPPRPTPAPRWQKSGVRSVSVSRGDRSAYQKWRYHDLCNSCSGAIAVSPSLRCAPQYGMAHRARQSAGQRPWRNRPGVNVRRDTRGVAMLTIDNPAKLNTLNTAVMR